MPGHGAIFDRRRPFADRYRVLHLAKPVPFQAGVPRAADRALRPEMLEKLLLQDTTRLNEPAFVDRLVCHPLLLFVRKVALEPTRDLLGRPFEAQFATYFSAQGDRKSGVLGKSVAE